MAFSCSVWAEWEQVSVGSSATTYADPATMKREGNRRRIWIVRDLNKIEYLMSSPDKGFLSIQNLMEIDCKEDKLRSLQLTFFRLGMANGEAILSFPVEDGNWSYIAPNTVDRGVLEYACSR